MRNQSSRTSVHWCRSCDVISGEWWTTEHKDPGRYEGTFPDFTSWWGLQGCVIHVCNTDFGMLKTELRTQGGFFLLVSSDFSSLLANETSDFTLTSLPPCPEWRYPTLLYLRVSVGGLCFVMYFMWVCQTDCVYSARCWLKSNTWTGFMWLIMFTH